MPTDLPDVAARVRRQRQERHDTIAHVAIALVATALFVWNLVTFQAEVAAVGASPSPYQGCYTPAEFGRRAAW